MHLRKTNTEFIAVGLGKDNRPFHHFTHEDKITLEPEPTNSFDPKAIRILVDKKFIGYVSKNDNGEIHRFFKRKDKNNNKHVFDFFLLDVYPKSARFLMVDLTLALKRVS